MGTTRRRVKVYPLLRSLADPSIPNLRTSWCMHLLREHAVELARASVLEDLCILHAVFAQLEDLQVQAKREHIRTRLKRLMPGLLHSVEGHAHARGEDKD